jgi:hypothetical protein
MYAYIHIYTQMCIYLKVTIYNKMTQVESSVNNLYKGGGGFMKSQVKNKIHIHM